MEALNMDIRKIIKMYNSIEYNRKLTLRKNILNLY